MPRPSSFHVAVIRYIHRKILPFSLKEVRDAVGIKDPKTIRVIIHRLEALGFVAYDKTAPINQRWVPSDKWPMGSVEPTEVLDAYVTAQILRRIV